jgi:hypothetical protein
MQVNNQKHSSLISPITLFPAITCSQPQKYFTGWGASISPHPVKKIHNNHIFTSVKAQIHTE